ncbi:unnamed protein product [Didymodactylos carnosus]|uniref:Uncharacterized protein n=1 Tax=Didymodactylos carnosus TaxID=1234261 RepID=A0A8S2E644_9BILA|nr:unnamed protein product [Didymodactylos carnosus]CAF3842242.1 unnamed protein product [Didymodactylos carnosus]
MRSQRQRSCPRCFSAHIMDLLRQASSKDMTMGDYIDYEQKLSEERNRQTELDDDLTAHALQLSLDDQQDAEQRLLLRFDAESNNQQYPSNDVTNVVEEQKEQEGKKQHDEFDLELWNIQTYEPPNNINQQQVPSNDTTVVEQNLIKEQNKHVQSNDDDELLARALHLCPEQQHDDDELLARALHLCPEQQHDDHLLAFALQAIENE